MTLPLTEAQRSIIESASLVNFGSGPSAYAFEYQRSGVKGFNFGMTPSTFSMEQQLLEGLAPILPRSCALILTVCPFSFGANNSDADPRVRYSRYFRMLESPEPSEDLWFPYEGDPERSGCDAAVLAQRTATMLRVWSREFSLPLTESTPLDAASIRARNAQAFEAKRTELLRLYETCETYGFRPYVLLPPLAAALRDRLPAGLLDLFLYDNMQKLPDLRVLDCTVQMADQDFCGPVFLSRDGAVRFTRHIAAQISA